MYTRTMVPPTSMSKIKNASEMQNWNDSMKSFTRLGFHEIPKNLPQMPKSKILKDTKFNSTFRLIFIIHTTLIKTLKSQKIDNIWLSYIQKKNYAIDVNCSLQFFFWLVLFTTLNSQARAASQYTAACPNIFSSIMMRWVVYNFIHVNLSP